VAGPVAGHPHQGQAGHQQGRPGGQGGIAGPVKGSSPS
jgi:hypothetical protein